MKMREVLEKAFQLIETIENMLRGMTLDPSIPQHAKDAMVEKINIIEKFIYENIGEIV